MQILKKRIKIIKILMLLSLLFVIGNSVLLVLKAATAASVNYVTQSDKISNPEAINFLVVGTDLGGNRTLEEDGVRTDVQMVMSFNPENERGNAEVNVMNIPRDVTTEYSCGGSGKINGGAYAAANAAIINGENDQAVEDAAVDCTVGTVENMLDITIDYYMVLNFDSFISVVDGIDGIDLINQYEFCEQDENGVADAHCFEEGEIHLDGSEALAYARQRHESSDYERGQRQQLIMTKIFAKVMANPTSYIDNFAKTLISDTINNLDLDLLLSLLNWASKSFNNVLESVSSGIPLYVDVKTSPFSNSTGFDLTDSLDSSLQANNTGTYPIYEIYDTYDTIEQSTNITRYMFTKDSLNLPTTVTSDEANISNTIEIQFISAYVHEDNSMGTYNSYIDDYTISYFTNQFSNGTENTVITGTEVE